MSAAIDARPYPTAERLAAVPDLSEIPWTAPPPGLAAELYRKALIADVVSAALDTACGVGRLVWALGALAAHSVFPPPAWPDIEED